MWPQVKSSEDERRRSAAFGGGAIVGTLGGVIGPGGAEFRIALLIGAFRFQPLEAIILNKYATRHLNVGKGSSSTAN